MAKESGRRGGTAATAFNAANEVAVAAFLKGLIPFLQIEYIIEKVLDQHVLIQNPVLEEIHLADQQSRRFAESLIELNS